MIRVRRSSAFIRWHKRLRDRQAVARINARIDRLADGNPGDVKPVGEGISEMRIDCGPGYRVYYKDTGEEIVVLLCGGDKRSQDKDVAEAKKIARLYGEEQDYGNRR